MSFFKFLHSITMIKTFGSSLQTLLTHLQPLQSNSRIWTVLATTPSGTYKRFFNSLVHGLELRVFCFNMKDKDYALF